MLKIKMIQVGKEKKGPFSELGTEYLKRLSAYAKTDVVIVKELSSDLFETNAFTIMLSEDGKTFDSKTFAENLTSWSEYGQREIVFVIADAFGFDRSLTQNADLTLSLSPMTMPHDLARIVLLEQLYRAGTILNGKTYHY